MVMIVYKHFMFSPKSKIYLISHVASHPKEVDVHFLRTFFNNCLRKCKSMQNLDLDRV